MLTGIPRPHLHQCGWTVLGFLDFGCGHIWKHTGQEDENIVRSHMCPKCGKGPWYMLKGE